MERIIEIEKSVNRISTTEIIDWDKMLKPLGERFLGQDMEKLSYPNDQT